METKKITMYGFTVEVPINMSEEEIRTEILSSISILSSINDEYGYLRGQEFA